MKEYEQRIVHDPAEIWADIAEDDLACQRASQRKTERDTGERSSPSVKVYCIVNNILLRGISHDYQDVLEYGVEGVLAWYGWHVALSECERNSLGAWLLGIGGWYQTREVARVIEERSERNIKTDYFLLNTT